MWGKKCKFQPECARFHGNGLFVHAHLDQHRHDGTVHLTHEPTNLGGGERIKKALRRQNVKIVVGRKPTWVLCNFLFCFLGGLKMTMVANSVVWINVGMCVCVCVLMAWGRSAVRWPAVTRTNQTMTRWRHIPWVGTLTHAGAVSVQGEREGRASDPAAKIREANPASSPRCCCFFFPPWK